ncbi:hypothetical protein [Sporosarcina pasteurii]|uniref:Inner spore coat protein n=1 Tax=Sporosarcina pasteurii TaxID=1474 RepID=A0A380BQZ4_SPOPA|nr:hypothetical protein [Sporosarcina pasteurii]MDS9471197.1 hypothetical protein [Sporosarcina pasteurii]QBQ05166.1 hypothetical protein E2C16_05550 [Sporosarcina pasteurii]SUJ05532.1 Uncharacterised protein [Sporosarcina pasteurii]
MHYLSRFAHNFPSKHRSDDNHEQKAHHNNPLLQNEHPNPEEHLFPPVNTSQFNASAKEYKALLKEAQILIEKILNSPDFAQTLMHEAQLSNQQKVDELIASTGITLKVKTTYSPSSVHIEIFSEESKSGCCILEMKLYW